MVNAKCVVPMAVLLSSAAALAANEYPETCHLIKTTLSSDLRKYRQQALYAAKKKGLTPPQFRRLGRLLLHRTGELPAIKSKQGAPRAADQLSMLSSYYKNLEVALATAREPQIKALKGVLAGRVTATAQRAQHQRGDDNAAFPLVLRNDAKSRPLVLDLMAGQLHTEFTQTATQIEFP